MKMVLERAIALGDTWVAALVEQPVRRHATPDHIALTADRHPVAILLGCGESFTALTPTGEPLTADVEERWCPGATAQLMRNRCGCAACAAAGSQPG